MRPSPQLLLQSRLKCRCVPQLGGLAFISGELSLLLLQESVTDQAELYAGAAAPAGQVDDAVVKELMVQCFGKEGQSEDPSNAFLRDYMQRQAWRGDGDGDVEEAPMSMVLCLPSQPPLQCTPSTSLTALDNLDLLLRNPTAVRSVCQSAWYCI